MKTIWNYALKGARSVTQRSPILANGQVIVTMNHGLESNFQGTVSALCVETGVENWRFERPHFFTQPVVAKDGSILTTGFDGFAHKIGRDGQPIWSKEVSERNLWAGILQDGNFIFSEIAGGSKFTWALDEQTGEVQWSYEDGGHSYGVAFDHAKSVIISSVSGSFENTSYSLHSVDIETGQGNWKAIYPDILFNPLAFQDFAILGSRGRIVAFNLADGSLASEMKVGDGADFNHKVIARNERVFLASNQGHVVSMDVSRKRGLFGRSKTRLSLSWETDVGSEIEFFGLEYGHLLCLTKSGHLHIISPDDGSHMESLKLPRFDGGMGITAVGENDYVTAVNRTCSRVKL